MSELIGTGGNDTLRGQGETEIEGRQGDDVIFGGSGIGRVHGNHGNDTLTGHEGGGTMFGGLGDDVLHSGQHAGAGQMHIYGGEGDDVFFLDQSDVTAKFGQHAWGNEGRDRFVFVETEGSRKITGRIDDFDISRDAIWVDGKKLDFAALPSNVRVIAYQDQPWLLINDRILYALEGARTGVYHDGHGDHHLGRTDEVHFIEWPEIFKDGVPKSFDIPYEDYVDVVPAWAFGIPAEQLNTIRGSGNETTGADLIEGTAGNDWIMGYDLDDTLLGGDGHDVIDGGEMNDVIRGGSGSDTISGGLDDDWMAGDGGDDLVFGGSGQDTILGGEGHDALHGNNGRDLIRGNGGNDSLYGGIGRDSLLGGAGNDILEGGDGRDRMIGGDGADVFVFRSDQFRTDGGSDVILDFGADDRIDLSDLDLSLVAELGGHSGELSWSVRGGVLQLRGDLDGDGRADLEIHVMGRGWQGADIETLLLL